MPRAWLLCLWLLAVTVTALDVERPNSEENGVVVAGLQAGAERQILMKKKKGKNKKKGSAAAGDGGPNAACACIFGFDNVIYHPDNTLFAVPGGGGKVPKDAAKVVNMCQEAGFNIGVASSNCFEAEMQRIMTEELESPVFTEEFLSSDAFQACDLDREPLLNAINKHYGVRPECAIYFDHAGKPEEAATATNVQFYEVDHAKGVTKKDVQSGVKLLTDECGCSLG